MLFDLVEDRFETTNRIHDEPDLAAAMRRAVAAFMDSCRASHRGADYPEPYEPINEFQELRGWWP